METTPRQIQLAASGLRTTMVGCEIGDFSALVTLITAT